MDHSESDALEAARARRGELHGALLDLEQALPGAAPGRAQAWADSVRATLVLYGIIVADIVGTVLTHAALHHGPLGVSMTGWEPDRRDGPNLLVCSRLTDGYGAGVRFVLGPR